MTYIRRRLERLSFTSTFEKVVDTRRKRALVILCAASAMIASGIAALACGTSLLVGFATAILTAGTTSLTGVFMLRNPDRFNPIAARLGRWRRR